MKKLRIIIYLVVLPSFSVAQFLDDFENYIPGQQLACQNPIDWTTWSNQPCDPTEDPFISSNYAFSGVNSVAITYYNDLIKPLGNLTSGRNYINFHVYIPASKTGYFSLLSRFNPGPNEWGMECYFDTGSLGRLMLVPGEPIIFNYAHNNWHYVQIVVDFNIDEAQFWIDGTLIYTWQWTQNGTVANQLAAHNYYGPSSNNEIYIDDYMLFDNCLYCIPPIAPSNLTAQEIFNPDPAVELNWQDNSFDEYAFNIIRKSGLPNNPADYSLIGTVPYNANQFIDTDVSTDSTYTYGVIAYNIYGYSDTSNTATITIKPVPVELTSFTASVSGNDVHLNWSTATELNNSGFEILRFAQNDHNAWQKIGFIQGQGTTTEQQFYAFNDESVAPGKYQYRFKQIDYDGTFEYSDIVEVEVGLPAEFSLSQNYPNPFNPSTTIRYEIPGQARNDNLLVVLKVYDVLGNEVATLVNEEKPAGSYEVEFSVGQNSILSISSGIYFYQLRAGKFVHTKKMILLK